MFQQPAEAVQAGAQGAQEPAAAAGTDFLQQLQMLGWVDRTALAVLLVFFVLGLFKGLIWQISRVAILVVAYVVAGRFGQPLGELLARTPAVGGTAPGAGAPPPDPPETTLYLAYVLLFVAVLVVLSLVAIVVQKLAKQVGLGFFDRLGGGVLGVATGACIVLFGLFVVHMFFPRSQLALAAEASHALRLSKGAIDSLGSSVPDDLRRVFELTPLQAPAAPAQPAGPAAPPEQPAPQQPPPWQPLPGDPPDRRR